MRDVDVLPVELLPDLLRAVDTIKVGPVHTQNLPFESLVAALARTGQPRPGGVISAGGELQHFADRLDPPSILPGLDVADYLLV